MTYLKDKTALVYDGGLFLTLAFRLARDFGNVLFYAPDGNPFPTPNSRCLGDGFDDIERVHDLYSTAALGIDFVVFPDVGHADLQWVMKTKTPVWGSGDGDFLELHRSKFKELQKELGMAVPEYEVVKGLSALRDYLSDHPDCYVKVSRYRGLMETHHWISGEVDGPWLDSLAVKLGPIQERISFIVEHPIDAVTELGIDTFCIDGQFPKVVVQGIESKDKGYIGAVTPFTDLPKELQETTLALAPTLKEHLYRNFFSSEVRITEDHKAYLTDPTCRMASPAGECLLELIGNLSEIVWEGAHGNLVEPEYTAKFAAQAIIDHCGDPKEWRLLKVSENVSQWVKLFGCCQVDGVVAFPPFSWSSELIGSVVGLGDTMEEAIDSVKEHAAELDGQPVEVHVDSLVDVLATIRDQEKADVPFTDADVPSPETALQT